MVVGTSNWGVLPAAEAGYRSGSTYDRFRSEARSTMPFGNGSTLGSVLVCSYEHQGLYQGGHGHDKLVAHLVAHMVGILPRTLKPCRAYKIIHLGEYMYILLFLAVESQL